uniref:WD40 repeat domain-containing protein n=1 Tax=Acidocella sp. TaxID=50710 RepID=UPI003FD7CEA7
VTIATDAMARLWDAESGVPFAVLRGHEDGIVAMALSPDGQTLLTASVDKTARLWDIRGGNPLMSLVGHGGAVRHVALSPDGKLAAAATEDRTVFIWSMQNGGILATLAGHTDSVALVSFAADSQRVLTVSDKTVRVWRTSDGLSVAVKSFPQVILAAAFFPDGKRVLTGGAGGEARIWDTETGNVTELSRWSCRPTS